MSGVQQAAGDAYAALYGGESTGPYLPAAAGAAASLSPGAIEAGIRGVAGVVSSGVSAITNPLPKTGQFARAVPEAVARQIEAGRRDIPLGKPGDPEVFITAAEDLSPYRTQSSVETRLTLTPARRAIVTFDYDVEAGSIASPVFRANPGFVGRGRTAGGAREWVIPNLPLDVQPIQNIRVRWLK